MKTSIFGGFKKADVLSYIETLQNNAADVSDELNRKKRVENFVFLLFFSYLCSVTHCGSKKQILIMKDIKIEFTEDVVIDKDKSTVGKSVLKKQSTKQKYYIAKRKRKQ